MHPFMNNAKKVLIRRTAISLLLSLSIVITIMLLMFVGIAAHAAGLPVNASVADGTYTAQYTKTDVAVTKNLNDTMVKIKGWQANYKYQIWCYQKITSDIFHNNIDDVQVNQWILSKAYAAGSTGTVHADGSINFTIDNFTSSDENCTVEVRIADENGNFVCEFRDTYTPTEVRAAEITKVLVDGQSSTGKEIKKIKSGASVIIKAIGNNIPNITYTATILDTLEQIPVSNTNEFKWDISSLAPRDFTIRITADNGTSTATKDIAFILYFSDTDIQYGVINSMAITGGTSSALPQKFYINANFRHGNFYYIVREQDRNAIISAGFMGEYSASQTIEQMITQYGIYDVYGYVSRSTIAPAEGTYDDGIKKQIEVKRSHIIQSSAALNANISLQNPVEKDTNIQFTASAEIGGIGTTPLQYSFWRYDSVGYALIKDWSSDNTLTWTPSRVGEYLIEVRAKGEDAGSYEVKKSVNVCIKNSGESIAQDVVISLNEAQLNLNTKARTPITIKAVANNTNEDDLLYKFYVTDKDMGITTLQNYSENQECIWIPRKAGIYEIKVLVKTQASFGKCDAMGSFEIQAD